jgi:hypothetical protein
MHAALNLCHPLRWQGSIDGRGCHHREHLLDERRRPPTAAGARTMMMMMMMMTMMVMMMVMVMVMTMMKDEGACPAECTLVMLMDICLLGSSAQVPLSQMIDLLVDFWEADGLYD